MADMSQKPVEPEKQKDTFYVQSIDRALRLINIIAEEGNRGLTLMELSSIVGLSFSTVYRLLQNLLRWHYVSLHKDGKYFLGLSLFLLGSQVNEIMGLVNIAKPHLNNLNEQCGEIIYLATFDDTQNNVLYIDKRSGKGNIRLVSTVGTHNGIHCSANGKALMFNKSDEEIRNILLKTKITKKTNNTMTDIDQIIAHINDSKKRGYAIDIEESEYNVACLASPIMMKDGTIIAAISISGLVQTITPPLRFDELRKMLLETSKMIPRDLYRS